MKSAIVFINLGTPAAPDTGAVRRFLREFLSDRRVVEVPRVIWWAILYLIILPFRSPRASKAYRQIWMGNISPLRYFSEALVAGVAEKLAREFPAQDIHTALAMTYGEPGISGTINKLRRAGCQRFLFLPLFPQYSATTTAAVHDQLCRYFSSCRDIPQWGWIRNYHDHPWYISALANTVRAHWERSGKAEKLLLSYHGIPRRNVDRGDPYLRHCEQTTAALVKELGLDDSQWLMSFQSRLGKAEWLKPYTDQTVMALAEQGIGSIDVICPAFATECLETLEEIDGEANALFREHGGERFSYVPCLNNSELHQDLMIELSREFLSGQEPAAIGTEKLR